MWTIAGYAQDFVKRHLVNDIFNAHRDKLDVTFLTQKKRADPHAGLLGIIITCPVTAKIQSYDLDTLLSRLEDQLRVHPPKSGYRGTPPRWNTDKSDIEGCVLLSLFFGVKEEAGG